MDMAGELESLARPMCSASKPAAADASGEKAQTAIFDTGAGASKRLGTIFHYMTTIWGTQGMQRCVYPRPSTLELFSCNNIQRLT